MDSSLNFSQQVSFGHGSDHRAGAKVDGRLRDTADPILVGEIGKFHGFYHFGFDHRAFQRHLMCEHHGSRAVWSGWGDKNLQVNGFLQAIKKLAGLVVQSRLAS